MKHRLVISCLLIGLIGAAFVGCGGSGDDATQSEADVLDSGSDADVLAESGDVGDTSADGADGAQDVGKDGQQDTEPDSEGDGGQQDGGIVDGEVHDSGDGGDADVYVEPEPPKDTEQALFSPVNPKPSISNVGFTTKSDGTPLAVIVSGGSGAKLNVLNLKTKQNVFSHQLTDDTVESHAWGFETLSDRTVMITLSSKRLYGLNPDTNKVTEYSNATNYNEISKVASFYWGVVRDENDKLYIATYHPGDAGGRVLTFDYKTKKWGDLAGRIQDKAAYVRSVAYENGFIYAGTGAVNPSIYKINVATGIKEKLKIEHHVSDGSTFVYTMNVKNNRVYARISYNEKCKGVCVFDGKTGAYLDEFNANSVITRPGQKDNVYYYQGVGGKPCLRQYDPIKKVSTEVVCSTDMGTLFGQNSWITDSLVASIVPTTGAAFLYDVKTKAATLTPAGWVKTPQRAIHSMTEGNGGNLYAGWYMPADSIAEFNVKTPKKYSLVEIVHTQPEGLNKSGDWILYGGYPGGKIGAVNPVTKEKRNVLTIGHNQDRPYAVLGLSGTQFAAFGSVPDYGHLGGVLAIYDVAAHKIDATYPASNMPAGTGVDAASLKDLSPISFAYKKNKLYVGTSIRGGLGINPTKKEAPLYVFDMTNRVVERISVPIAGQAAVAALAFGTDGKLYGVTSQFAFEVNPTTLQVVRKQNLNLGGNSYHAGALYFDKGMLYGNTGGTVFEMKASDFSTFRKLATGNYSVLASDGNLYYGRAGTVYRWIVKR